MGQVERRTAIVPDTGLSAFAGAFAAGPLPALGAARWDARLVRVEAAFIDERSQAGEGAHHALARGMAREHAAASHQHGLARFS